MQRTCNTHDSFANTVYCIPHSGGLQEASYYTRYPFPAIHAYALSLLLSTSYVHLDIYCFYLDHYVRSLVRSIYTQCVRVSMIALHFFPVTDSRGQE